MRIIISAGEPAGVGPDIVLQIAQKKWPAELIVVGDPDLFKTRAKQLTLPIEIIPFDSTQPIEPHQPGTLKIISVALNEPCKAGQLNRHNVAYTLRCLEIATDFCLENKGATLVTGPLHKGVINEAGIAFTGHTEFLAQRCKVKQSLMLFVTPSLKVALVTTHLPLSAVPAAITRERLISTIELLNSELQKRFNLSKPSILVSGLNPHAGESGHLGREEIDIIKPALDECRAKSINVTGPLPADTIFTEKYLETADAILAMYHDQALPVVKFQGFSNAVNVTLGLPILRTSVDHGTALDVAGTLKADAGSLSAAIQLAIDYSG